MPDREHQYRSFSTKLLEWYLYSSIHIGICAALLTIYGFVLNQGSINWYYVLFVGTSTIFLYNLHRVVGIYKMKAFNHLGRFAIIYLYRWHIVIYAVLAGSIALYSFVQLPQFVYPWIAISSLLSISYTLPVFRGLRLRDFNYIKLFIIAIAWVLICVFIPALITQNINQSIWMHSLAMALFFIGITIPFDVRDVQVDSSIQVKTLATSFGEKRAYGIARISIFISSFLVAYLFFTNENMVFEYVVWLTNNVLVFLLLSVRSNSEDWWYSLVFDGTIGFFAVLYLIIQAFV